MKKIFVCKVNYKVAFSEIERVLVSHREYLKQGYEAGNLLASGPRNPKNGGLIIAQFATQDEAIEFARNDPFCLQNVAEYEIIEFEPVLHASCLDGFLKNY